MELLGVAVALVMGLCAVALLGHLDRLGSFVTRLWRRVRPRPEVSDTVSVEQLAADLRRLADLLERTYATEQPAKMARLTAAALAYDYVLLSACRTLEIPTPQTVPMSAMDRLVIEAALARSGLDW